MEQPKHIDMQTPNGTQFNLDALYQIAPSCFTEAKGIDGEVHRVVDFNKLRLLLGDQTVEDAPEVYEFTWVGKRAALQETAAPIRKTLRPYKEESVNWDTTQNLYIEGDNLEVLKLLQNSYMSKVKMIYIDPPYNTGNDFVYHDDFHRTQQEEDEAAGVINENGQRMVRNTNTNGKFHSDWCSMIYARLLASRSLLKEDGVIFISIDDKESDNLRKICDEVFGESNFVANIIWQSRTSISNDDEVSTNHNHTFIYSKVRELLTFGGDDIDASEYINPDNDPRGPWKLVPIDANHVGGDTNYPIKNPKTGIDYYPPTGRIWCYNKATMQELMKDGRIKFGLSDDSSPKRKLFFNERKEKGDVKTPSSILLDAGTTKSGTTEIMSLFDGMKIFDYPKPTTLIARLMKYGFIRNNDIVLDFFSGSATTAHASFIYQQQENYTCKFILVQFPENLDESLVNANNDAKKSIKVAIDFLDSMNKPHNICEIGKERIRRAGKKIKEESPLTTQDLDTGFRVFKCEDSNYKEVAFAPKEYTQDMLAGLLDNIKEDRNDLDLLFDCMLRWGVGLSLPLSTTKVDGCTIHNVNEGDLVGCFDGVVTEKVIDAIAAMDPVRVVFRDSSFTEAANKMNLFELFKQKCSWTDEEVKKNVRVI